MLFDSFSCDYCIDAFVVYISTVQYVCFVVDKIYRSDSLKYSYTYSVENILCLFLGRHCITNLTV